jgi:hypothetical protein
VSRKFVPQKLRTFVDFIVEFRSPLPEPKPRLFQDPGICSSASHQDARQLACSSQSVAFLEVSLSYFRSLVRPRLVPRFLVNRS